MLCSIHLHVMIPYVCNIKANKNIERAELALPRILTGGPSEE